MVSTRPGADYVAPGKNVKFVKYVKFEEKKWKKTILKKVGEGEVEGEGGE
jgi:hypothetical protein